MPDLLIRSQKPRNSEIIDLSDFWGVQSRMVQAVFSRQNWPFVALIIGWRRQRDRGVIPLVTNRDS